MKIRILVISQPESFENQLLLFFVEYNQGQMDKFVSVAKSGVYADTVNTGCHHKCIGQRALFFL